MSTNSNPNLLPTVSVSATQQMRHNNAFGGSAVSMTFGIGTNGWSACAGTEIEVWGQGYVDLLARRGSTGLKFTFSDALEAGVYYLKWSARGRWAEDTTGNPAENKYTVKFYKNGQEFCSTMEFDATIIAPQDSAEVLDFAFTLDEPAIVSVEFVPSGTGTRGPLIGTNPSLELVEIEVRQTNYPENIVGNTDFGGNEIERVINEGDIAWITGTPNPARLQARLKCSALLEWSCTLCVNTERTEVTRKNVATENFCAESGVLSAGAVLDITGMCPVSIVGGIFHLSVLFKTTFNSIGHVAFPEKSFFVRGRNPSDAVVKAEILHLMGSDFPYAWAIAAHESYEPSNGTTYNQFNTEGGVMGTPNFGYKDGWGIGQIDYSVSGTTASTEEVYNWRTNINSIKKILKEKREMFLRIKEKAERYWERMGVSVSFPSTYFYEGVLVSSEMLSVCVYYNGASGRNGDNSGSLPKYDGSSFPWELVNEELVFVDNGNNYAKKIAVVLNGEMKYVE